MGARSSIKSRMTIAVGALVVVLFSATAILTLGYFQQAFKHEIIQQQERMLALVAQNIDERLNLARRSLSAVAAALELTDLAAPERVQAFLDQRPGTATLFDNGLFIFSHEGRLVAESPFVSSERRGRDISFRDYFQETTTSGHSQISAPYLSTHTPGQPAVIVTVPIFDGNGVLRAVCGGSINLLQANLLGELARVRIGATGHLQLFAEDGTILVDPDPARIMARSSAAARLFDETGAGFEGSREGRDDQGRNALSSFVYLKQAPWVLAAHYPVAEAYQPLTRARTYLLVAILCIAGLTLVATRLLIGRLTLPLRLFSRHVRSLGERTGGDRFFQAAPTREIKELADGFKEKLDALDRQHEQTLRNQEQLKETETLLLEAQRMAKIGNWDWDVEQDRLVWSDQIYRIFGVPEGTKIEGVADFLALIHPDDRARIEREIRVVAPVSGSVQREYRVLRPDSSVGYLIENVESVVDSQGRLVRRFGTIQDITETRKAERAVAIERAKLFRLFEGLPAYVCLKGADHKIHFANRYFRERFGDITGGRCFEILRGRREPCAECLPLTVLSTGEPVTWEWAVSLDGCCYQVHDYPFADADGQPLVLEIGFDVTARKRAEEQLRAGEAEMRRLAHYDPLTGLPNRLLFQEHLQQAMGKARRHGHRLALMFLDLDRFKIINDTLGHDMGDRLLREVAHRLRGSIRETDTVARFGGDEFLVLVEEINEPEQVAVVARKIMHQLSQPLHLDRHELQVTVSIGIAFYPNDAQDLEGLMRCADSAMFRAKDRGRNSCQFYGSVPDAASPENRQQGS
jgi:diguanylate cyclase (GGDEF)-like protein